VSRTTPRRALGAHGGERRGFALLVVLFVLALVGAAAIEFHTALRADRRITANVRAAARARWAARGALAGELARLQGAVRVTTLAAERLAPVGDTLLPPRSREVAGVAIQAVITDVRARLHVNRASEVELSALASALGLPRTEAGAFADRMLDWRDPDDLPRAHGAEAGTYAAARAASRPRNGPFHDVDEVAGVHAVTPALHRRLAPLLTAAGDGRINVNSATVEVLRTIPGVDADAARALVAWRAASPFRSVHDVVGALPEPARSALSASVAALGDGLAFAPRYVEVRVHAQVPGGTVGAQLVAMVLLAGGSQMQLLDAVEREVRTTPGPPVAGATP
jgi:general secretion pathway protein K